MQADFIKQFENVNQQIRQIYPDFQDLTRASLHQEIKLRSVIKGKLQSIRTGIDYLQRVLQSQESKLLPNELNRRRLMINKLQNTVRSLQEKLLIKNQKTVEMDSIRSTSDYSQFRNSDLQSMQTELLKKQDQQIDLLIDTTNSLKVVSQNMNTELKDQLVMLEQVEESAERVTQKMTRTQKRMINLIDKTSNSCLVCLILVLIITLILLLIYLQINKKLSF